jgi:hypothetical protein
MNTDHLNETAATRGKRVAAKKRKSIWKELPTVLDQPSTSERVFEFGDLLSHIIRPEKRESLILSVECYQYGDDNNLSLTVYERREGKRGWFSTTRSVDIYVSEIDKLVKALLEAKNGSGIS